MKHETVVVTDDLDGSEGASTILFALEGRAYQIDLNEENAEELRDKLAMYIQAGRLVGRGTNRPLPLSVAARSNRNDPSYVARLKAWARDNNYQVPARGRVPRTVVAAYHDQGGR